MTLRFMVKGIIFDLDGTLIDSHEAYALAYKKVLESYGINIKKEEVEKLFGMTAEDIIKRLLPNLSIEKIKNIVKEKSKIFNKNIDLINLHPCAKSLIKKLSKKYVLALATSSSLNSANLLLTKFKWNSFFKVVLTSYDVPNPKPAPDILIKTAKLLGLDIKDCLFIGDSIYDALSAKSAGMKFIGVETGSFTKLDFKERGFISYSNLCELESILL